MAPANKKKPAPKKPTPPRKKPAPKKVSQEKIDIGASEVLEMHGPVLDGPPKEVEQRSDPTRNSDPPSGGEIKPTVTENMTQLQSTNEDQNQKDTTAPSLPVTATAKPVEKPAVLNSGLSSLLRKDQPQDDNSPHLIVEARAGTGKTTTLVEGLKVVKGLPTKLTPSPQQKAVWDCMALSKGKINSIGFVAFNKSIAEELKSRVPAGCEAMTMHALGLRAVKGTFNLLPGKEGMNDYRVQNIICEITKKDIWDLRREKPVVLKATEELVRLCKMNLKAGSQEDLDELSSYYDVELGDETRDYSREVYELVPRVIDRCKDVGRDRCVDFNDMIWLPVVLSLPVQKYDLLLVDEAQDLNRCQQALAKKAGRRLILCGDPKQAIYGFAGADAESMSRMALELDNQRLDTKTELNGRGCITLPLTVTRRCGKAIVREANRYVPDFEAFETNPEGSVGHAQYKATGDGKNQYMGYVSEGDFILCRVNAPLVSECFKFLKMGCKANIQGRDIGRGLITLINKMKCHSVQELIQKIDEWKHKERDKELAKRNPSEQKIQAIEDKADCLTCFTDRCDRVEQVIAKIESIFTDDKNSTGIRLSSIHKAKGLEAKRVFILQAEGMCGPPMDKLMDWEREQEMNLRYVAVTRAIEELVYVS